MIENSLKNKYKELFEKKLNEDIIKLETLLEKNSKSIVIENDFELKTIKMIFHNMSSDAAMMGYSKLKELASLIDSYLNNYEGKKLKKETLNLLLAVIKGNLRRFTSQNDSFAENDFRKLISEVKKSLYLDQEE